MKRILLILLYLNILTVASGQDAQEIVERYTAAINTSLDSTFFEATQLTGEICVKGNLCFPTNIWWHFPMALRMEMKFQEVMFVMIWNDSLTYEHNPLAEMDKVERNKKSTGEKGGGNGNPMNYVSYDLINYLKDSSEIKLTGREILDSLETYTIVLTRDAIETVFNINTKTFFINKITQGDKIQFFLKYKNYDGFIFPGIYKEKGGDNDMEMRIDEVSRDKIIPDSLFQIPTEALEKFYNKANHPNEDDFENLMNRGKKKYDEGDLDSAFQLFSKAIKINNSSDRAYNFRGLVKLNQQKYYDAISDFTRALELNDRNASVYNNLGLAKYNLGDFKGAIIDYNKAISYDSTLSTFYSNRGLSHYSLEQYRLAYTDFTLAISREPTKSLNYFNRGATLAQLESYEDALDDYRRSIEWGDHSAKLYNFKGVSEYRLENYDSAVLSFNRAIVLEEDNAQYIKNLASALYRLQKFKEALEYFKKALEFTPEDDDIYNYIGLCHYSEENYKLAINAFSNAIRIDPKNALYLDNRASSKENIEDYVGAIQDYDQSIKIYPNDPKVFYNRGMIKIWTSKKYEGCLDLATANEMEYEPAKQAILENCN